MGLLDRIAEEALKRAQGRSVADVRLGLGYSCVCLDDGALGLAYTFRQAIGSGGCTVFRGLRPLAGQPVEKLLMLLGSRDLLERTVGLATANALFNTDAQEYRFGDILEQVEIGPGDTVSMVGHFAPLVGAIKGAGADLKIFEKIDAPSGGLLPEDQAPLWLGRSALSVITATSLINGTADGLLEAAGDCAQVVMLGPSTPLCPEVFSETPVKRLSGVVVADAQGVCRTVSEGGGTRMFMPFVKKVNLDVA